MRKQQKTMLSLLLAIVTLCLVNPIVYATTTNDATKKKSELNIQIIPQSTDDSSSPGGSDSTESGGGGAGGSSSNSNTKKPSAYTPSKATVVQNLPQTGEIVTSFVVVILGLSLLMFTIGVLINKRVSENYIEMELHL